MASIESVLKELEKQRSKKRISAWERGVFDYAKLLLDLAEKEEIEKSKDLLNGSKDWRAFSYGGMALIYDGDIAGTLCTPSELARTKGGRRNPNGRENWCDVQARALYQAALKIDRAIETVQA